MSAAPLREAKSKAIFRGYIPELEGIRAIGICGVILNHMWPWESYSRPLFLLLQLPWMMMDGFFVLSGFLITGILLDSRERPDYYRSFFTRRGLRILPIYYAVLLLITIAAVVHGHAAYRDMLAHWGSPWWFFVYIGNIPTAMTGLWPLAAGGALVPLWSLQIEEQFYLLFPFLVHRLQLKTLVYILVSLCCFSTVLRLVLYWRFPANELVQYVLLPCHWDGLAIGALIAIRFRQGPWNINRRLLTATMLFWGFLSLGSAAWAGFFHTTPFNRTIGFLIASIWFGYVVLWLVQFRGTRWTAWLRAPLMRYLGKISYGAYLLHWPVANGIATLVNHFAWPGLGQGLIGLVLIYAFTFGLAALSWHFFESPLLQLKDRLFPDARVARSASAV